MFKKKRKLDTGTIEVSLTKQSHKVEAGGAQTEMSTPAETLRVLCVIEINTRL